MSKAFKASYIAGIIDGECLGGDVEVDNFSSLSEANSRSISFYDNSEYKNDFLKTKAKVVILKKNSAFLRDGSSIIVDDPYLAFAKVSSLFLKKLNSYYIHESSYISFDATLSDNISIGAYSTIGSNSTIQENVYIGTNSSIGENVLIGSNTIIHSNVTIESNVKLGKNCEILSGARIGTSGFGFAREKDGAWVKIPQVGKVIIGDNVDIGANTTIDRGAIENTIIHDGVKIDNLVQIGHNCSIGENTIIAGCAGIAGSTKIGKNCMIGGAAMIKGHISIADGTIISGGSTIAKTIDNSGKRFSSLFPYNIEHKDWLRIAYNLKNLGKKNE